MREVGINKIHIIGTLLDNFKYSNKFTLNNSYDSTVISSEELFFENKIKININGNENIINILLNKKLIGTLTKGDKVNIYGQLRSRYIEDNNRKKMLFYVYVLDIGTSNNNKDINVAELEGYISSKNLYRITNSNGPVYSSILKVHRYYKKTDYLPIVVWGINASIFSNLEENTKVSILGEIRSREYRKSDDNFNECKIAYEVSVLNIKKIFTKEEID